MLDITLTIASQVFSGWTSMSVGRALDKMASYFRLSVTMPAGKVPFENAQILPFSACVVKIEGQPVLTGFIDSVEPEIDANRHVVSVSGRSSTCDLVDCCPEISSGQYRGYTLEQIARAVCAPFNIKVVVQTNASQIFPDATYQRTETAYNFLERLARLSGVLLSDDEQGRLVLATTGSTRAAGRLVLGQNVLHASAKLSGEHRFSKYIVKGQRALNNAMMIDPLANIASLLSVAGGSSDSAPSSAPLPIVPVATALNAVAIDGSVPRYRPHTSIAEAQLDQAGMQRRANWERNYALGRGTEAEVTVKGWRQGGLDASSSTSPLWQLNQLVSTTIPALGIDQDLLIVSVDYRCDDRDGRTTRLKIGPVEGYTPDPGAVKLKVRRGRKGYTTPNWDALNAISLPGS